MSHFLPIVCMFLNAPAGRMRPVVCPPLNYTTQSNITSHPYIVYTYLAEVGASDASAGIFTPDLGSSVLDS